MQNNPTKLPGPVHPAAEEPRRLCLLTSVGSTPEPVIECIKQLEPTHVCFFVSPQSREQTLEQEIIPRLKSSKAQDRLSYSHYVETPDPESLEECYRVLRQAVPTLLSGWHINPDELVVDITGGTKVMTASLVIATLRYTPRYYYVGSKSLEARTENQNGWRVRSGDERVIQAANPWQLYAEEELQQMAVLFDSGRFSVARELAEKIARMVHQEQRALYMGVCQAIEAYAAWDLFAYRKATNLMKQSIAKILPYALARDSTSDPIARLGAQLKNHKDLLEKLAGMSCLSKPELHRLQTLDLLANARRRGALEGRYDDAVARLYAALESLARDQLKDKYGIDNGSAAPEQIPESIRMDFVARYSRDGRLSFGLEASYILLAELGDTLGLKYRQRSKELRNVLNARNQSRLAHGAQPVEESTFKNLWQITLEFANVHEQELPEFPRLQTNR